MCATRAKTAARRHLPAASCYDVERGAETCRLPLKGGISKGELSVGRVGNNAYVVLQSDKGRAYYRVVVAK